MMANSIAGRKKREAGKRIGDGIKEDRMPLCSDISPSLLGPLVVDQSPTTMDKVDFGCHHCNPHQSSYCCRWRNPHDIVAGGEGACMGWQWRWMGS